MDEKSNSWSNTWSNTWSNSWSNTKGNVATHISKHWKRFEKMKCSTEVEFWSAPLLLLICFWESDLQRTLESFKTKRLKSNSVLTAILLLGSCLPGRELSWIGDYDQLLFVNPNILTIKQSMEAWYSTALKQRLHIAI